MCSLSIGKLWRGVFTMSVKVEELEEALQWIVKFAPIFKKLHTTDVAITISDREKVVEQLMSNSFSVDYAVGRMLDPQEPMSVAMKSNEIQVVHVPEEYYGVALNVILVPIEDENNRVIGCIAVSKNLDNQLTLQRVAEQFSASSEEMSASTEQLASSSVEFNNFMKNLAEAQSDMSQQVENTTKILEMINAVAKNTRILGFNAGIEAARSGEYGRGFSVVAREITKLADQSANSVNEIKQLLDQLKGKVDQVATIVKDTVEIADSQSTSINEISETIQHLTEVAEDIEELAKKL